MTGKQKGKEIDMSAFTVQNLKWELKERELSTKGTKVELAQRLSQALANEHN